MEQSLHDPAAIKKLARFYVAFENVTADPEVLALHPSQLHSTPDQDKYQGLSELDRFFTAGNWSIIPFFT